MRPWPSLLCLLAAFVPAAAAKPSPVPSGDIPARKLAAVPEPLRPWIPWVLRGQEERLCPELSENDRICQFLSRLSLDVKGNQARFVLEGRIFSPGLVSLPGDSLGWPREVRAGGKPMPVMPAGEGAAIRLPAGPFRIEGTLSWDAPPQAVKVPPGVALIQVVRNELPLDGTGTDEEGMLWLGKREEDAPDEGTEAGQAQDMLDLRVFRQLEDGIPMTLETRIEMDLDGAPRTLKLGRILPAGSRVLSMQTALSAKLSGQGELEVQGRPGHWEITVRSRFPGFPTAFAAAGLESPWPAREIWSLRQDPSLRQIQLKGNSAIDPSQSGVPAEWARLPGWAVGTEAPLELQEIARGQRLGDSLHAQLRRTLWRSADGSRFTVQDRLQGKATSAFHRLSWKDSLQVGRAELFGKGQILTSLGGKEKGIPVPPGELDILLLSVLPFQGTLEVSPIPQSLDRAELALHWQPGTWLLEVLGPNRTVGTVAASWHLADLAVLALIALLIGRRHGWKPAVFTTLLLSLSHHILPSTAGFVLHLLIAGTVAAILLRRLRGKVAILALRGWVALAALLLACNLVPELLDQAKLTVFPGLENPNGLPVSEPIAEVALVAQPTESQEESRPSVDTARADTAAKAETPSEGSYSEARTVVWAPSSPASVMSSSVLDKISSNSDGLLGEEVDASQENVVDAILAGGGGDMMAHKHRAKGLSLGDGAKHSVPSPPRKRSSGEDAYLDGVVSTGPALPVDPTAATALCKWDGEVPGNARITALWVPPFGVRLWRAFVILGWIAVLLRLVRLVPRIAGIAHLRRRWKAVAKLALPALLLLGGNAHASDIPSKQMLDELRTHLLETESQCGESCVDLARAQITVSGKLVRIQLSYDAQERQLVTLPQLTGISLRTTATPGIPLSRHGNDLLALIEAGRHDLTLEGSWSAQDISIQFPQPVRRMEVSAPGWTRTGAARNVCHLSRSAASAPQRSSGQADSQQVEIPAFVEVTRRLRLGREWSVSNEVRRIAPKSGPIALAIPLLHGEKPLGDLGADSSLRVVLGPNESVFRWESRLPKSDSLLLRAASNEQWVERWSLEEAGRYDITSSGVPEVAGRSRQWWPRPGESLHLRALLPKALPGSALTVVDAKLSSEERSHRLEHRLDLMVNASQAGSILIRLPAGLKADSLQTASMPMAPAQHDSSGSLRLQVPPGLTNATLHWHEASDRSPLRSSPRLESSVPLPRLEIRLPERTGQTTLLLAGDGRHGWVLWWLCLPLLGLLAWLSRRVQGFPLHPLDALLLMAGLTFASANAPVLVLVWGGLVALRRRVDAGKLPGAGYFLLQSSMALVSLALAGAALTALVRGGFGMIQLPTAGPQEWLTELPKPGSLPTALRLEIPTWFLQGVFAAWGLVVLRRLPIWARRFWTAFGDGDLLRNPDGSELSQVSLAGIRALFSKSRSLPDELELAAPLKDPEEKEETP